ncbi:hypothetical protein AB0B25_31330 [Nocardia sp. NPDC049190]|uniref:hypothetical protein n=1 Tax=Nocardia sp. NPDC049190 TaxID=3155650 RepID=UPI0033D60549
MPSPARRIWIAATAPCQIPVNRLLQTGEATKSRGHAAERVFAAWTPTFVDEEFKEIHLRTQSDQSIFFGGSE